MVSLENGKEFKTLEELKAAVEENDGVLTLEVRVVRDAYGADRLGVNVRANISKALKGLGLGHYPAELPEYQHQPVRLYKLGSKVADLIDAVFEPGDQHDKELREAAGGSDSEIVRKIRELVS